MDTSGAVDTKADSLRVHFLACAKAWDKRHAKEKQDELTGKMLEYGAAVADVAPGPFWALLKSQILHQARMQNITPEEFIDGLFSYDEPEIIILALQA